MARLTTKLASSVARLEAAAETHPSTSAHQAGAGLIGIFDALFDMAKRADAIARHYQKVTLHKNRASFPVHLPLSDQLPFLKFHK